MPKLLLFAACENVLISQNNNVSLIVLLSQVTLSGDIPDPLPENAATQMRWYLFSEWEITPEEVGIRFEQIIQLVRGDGIGIPGVDITTQFTPEAGKPRHRVVGSLTFFPLIPAAQYRLRLSIRRAEHNDWNLVGDYPLEVVHQRQSAPVSA